MFFFVLALAFFFFLARGAALLDAALEEEVPAHVSCGLGFYPVVSGVGMVCILDLPLCHKLDVDGDGGLPVDRFLEKEQVWPSYGGKRGARNA